ncbi:uncharacterized protein [Argopecten irradians]|uniref:uncharacterized protein n=1 Tax=Argopecten irradians TaxID=31199 RepID=UPI003721D75C
MLTRKEKNGDFKVNFSTEATPFVYEHIIDDVVIIPGAAYAEAAFELGMSMLDVTAESLQVDLTDDVARQINQMAIHPAILDAMLHSSALIFFSKENETSYKIYPIRIGKITVFRSFEKEMVCYTRIIQEVYNGSITNILLTRPDGLILAEVKEIEHQIMDGKVRANALAYNVNWIEEDMKPAIEEDEATQEVTICYEDSSVLNTLRKVYPHGNSFRLSDMAEDPSAMISGTSGVDTVLFVPDSNIARQSEIGDDLFHNVCKNCEAFFKAIKEFKDTDRGLFGSEMWGFARSLRQEGKKCRMVLIDVQPSIEAEVETLHSDIKFLLSGNTYSLSEFLISGGKLHGNVLQHRLQSGLQNEHRKLTSDASHNLELRSTESDRIVNPSMIPASPLLKPGKNEIVLQVDEIHVHSSDGIGVTELDSSLQKSLWGNYKDGYPVIALEFIGTVMCPRKSRSVVVCYPTRITNRVAIPEQCVCDRATLPMYTPGLITKALMMWSLMKKVKQKTDVCIVTDSSSDGERQLLCDMLTTVKHSQVHISSIGDLSDRNESAANVYIMLEKYPRAQIELILEPGNTVIGNDDVLSCISTQPFQISTQGVNAEIIMKKNIFEDESIRKTFPKVTQWLKRQSRGQDSCYSIPKPLEQHIVKLPRFQKEEKIYIQAKATEDNLIHTHAAYVVVGGLTGLGWEIVKWLGCQGAGVVVSLSRKGHIPEMDVKLQNAMDIHRYEIVPMRCDIVEYADVEKTFSDIKTRFPNHPIKGIFQGAGILRDTRIETMTMDKFKEELQPKVLGSWNLQLASEKLLLDFFVMHSSTTSVFGNAGQTNYGAVNAFMDSLALFRRGNNLPAQSINWGALEVGMVKNEDIKNNEETLGYHVLETGHIKECLLDALIKNPCQIVYGLFDWNIIGKNPAMMRTSTSDRDELSESPKSAGKGYAVNTVINISELMEASFEDQRQTIANLMLDSVSRVLAVDENELAEGDNLLNMGMESQKSIELIQVMKEAIGCRLPIAYILSANHSIGMLIDFVHSNFIDNFNSNTQGDLEIKVDVKGSPSWMEKFYIDIHNKNQFDSSLWYSVDFKVGSGLSDIDMWKTVMRWITIRNPELRTVYQPTNGPYRFGMKKVIHDPDDAQIDVRLVDSRLFEKQTDEYIKEYCTFDITSDPPVRVLYCDSGKKHLLRFIISHVSFDLQSFFSLLHQFQPKILSYYFKEDVDLTPFDVPDIASLMEDRLHEEKTFLENFWREDCQRIQAVPTIVRTGIEELISEKTEKLSYQLPDELVERLNANDFEVTSAVLLFSLYQILLQQMTCLSTIPVVMMMDMRQHFPEFNDRFLLGTNYVPVITEFLPADSWCLIIQTTKRWYCFKSSDYFVVHAWKARVRKLVSLTKRKSSEIGIEKQCVSERSIAIE